MNDYREYLTDVDNFDITYIDYEKMTTKTIYNLYNNNVKMPLHNFWFIFTNCKFINIQDNNKNNTHQSSSNKSLPEEYVFHTKIQPNKNKTFIIESNSSSSKNKANSKLIIESDDEGPCEEEKKLKKERQELNETIKNVHKNCEISKYETIYKYFNPERSSTYKDLLNALMHYYKK